MGNNLGIRIPKYLAGKLHVSEGALVNLKLTNNGLIISTEESELDILLNNITDSNRYHELLSNDKMKGNETW
ncbi:AbrB/MazE/SpoVT family DNA-binding domain-containing protein [Rickettsia endosymbiont of Ixodes scapularis]|uniref:AbrB/MazE/SpoVT family DNA-binding domain-containing protein n=1 Tax=Rickettsia endosymbiont of Ixodes scapularis TaxID=444612 RepID=UPI0001A60990|nr:MazF family transcriptional regulator [Rickettsia endosymbiont of Ixodes scapularis]EER21327.1 transcriptional regulator/antitoxin, MazE [Rickettsia endosymbiont of Ixodes scapularis]